MDFTVLEFKMIFYGAVSVRSSNAAVRNESELTDWNKGKADENKEAMLFNRQKRTFL